MVFLVFFLLIGSADALVSLGEYDQNTCVNIKQSCGDCSFVNATITFPNSSTALANASLENIGSGSWIFANFCNTTDKGRYDVFGLGDPNGTLTPFATFFTVGKQAPVGESLIYILFIVILFSLVIFSLYFIFVLPKENEKDERGFENKLVKLKYLRVLLLGITYGLFVVIMNLLTGLSVRFTSFGIFEGTIGFLFETLIRVSWPFYFILVVWVLYMLIHDSNVARNLNKLTGVQLG